MDVYSDTADTCLHVSPDMLVSEPVHSKKQQTFMVYIHEKEICRWKLEHRPPKRQNPPVLLLVLLKSIFIC